MTAWLHISRGDAPLVIGLPHTGLKLAGLEERLVSPWMARKDADYWVQHLYGFAGELGATLVRTEISRTVIDVNRDPSGASLYPGQATTGLCPVTTFDGEPLYRPGREPDDEEIAGRRTRWFDPYHAALTEQIKRLRSSHRTVVLYDAHSIRSQIPRLFEGDLPHLNLGDNSGSACSDQLSSSLLARCQQSPFSAVLNGRFKGGWTTRRYGRPEEGVHAVQMELACRGYLDEPQGLVSEENWPAPFDASRAAPLVDLLKSLLILCRAFAEGRP